MMQSQTSRTKSISNFVEPLNSADLNSLFDSKVKSLLINKKRTELLVEIDSIANELFAVDPLFESHRQVFGPENVENVVKAINKFSWESVVEDGTPEFWKFLDVVFAKNRLVRGLVMRAFEAFDGCGFNEFERTLLHGSALIQSSFDSWYKNWEHSIRIPQVVSEIQKLNSPFDPKFSHHHTIIHFDASGNLTASAYASFFPEEIGEIVAKMQMLALQLKKLENKPEYGDNLTKYIQYFEMYADALAETNLEKIEAKWFELDKFWTSIRFWIQIVHGQEMYDDPMRTKISPDFAVILVDERYAEHNQTIQNIQALMVEYFTTRANAGKVLAQRGLQTLSNSFATINFLPFRCGVSSHSRFFGQSLPNNSDAKVASGCKIYFDPGAGDRAVQANQKIIRKIMQESDWEEALRVFDITHILTHHVSAHEIGHAIYELAALEDILRPDTITLLEEPRAELTTVFMIHMLYQKGVFSLQQVTDSFKAFALYDLRYLSMNENFSYRPYSISAIYHFGVYEELGYAYSVGEGKDRKLKFDESKTLAVLETMSQHFIEILDAEDRRDVTWIEDRLESMTKMSELTKFCVDRLTTDL